MAPLIYLFYLLSIWSAHDRNIVRANPMRGHNIRLAEENEFPYIVSIGNRHNRNIGEEEDAHECGGSLISREHVLTSAHCLKSVKYLGDFEIIVGSVDLRGGERYRVYDAVTYMDWAKSMCLTPESTDHDIAILTLTKCVSKDIKLPKITDEANPDSLGSFAKTAGWGLTEEGPVSRYLKTASLNLLSKAECAEELNDYINVTRICTKNDPYTLIGCGDSGGPLVADKGNVIIGINDSTCPSRDLRPDVSNSSIFNLHLIAANYRLFIKMATGVRNLKCTVL